MLTVRLNRLGLKPGDLVLDLGCGEGRHVHGLIGLQGVDVVGVDLDEPSLHKARDGLAQAPRGGGDALLMKADAYRLPFADGAFDVVICSEVLEHLHDYPAALREIRRVLKPGGRFAPTVPRAWPERICWRLAPGVGGYADQPGGHVRIFNAKILSRRIVLEGFLYRGRHFAHALHSPYWWLKTAFWARRDDHPLVRIYHRLLVWDLMKRPAVTRWAETVLDPVMGKSVALYFDKAERP
jgi:SAM-dependent methyltransferase